MDNLSTYADYAVSEIFRKYASSPDAKIEQALLLEAFLKFLPALKKQPILDAGCGTGWLAQELSKRGYAISACDLSPDFISELQKIQPQIPAKIADLSQNPSYPKGHFGTIILNMVGHDLKNLSAAFQSLFTITAPGGKIILTLANPYYSYPVGCWKRGIIGRLLFRKPHLKLWPYNFFKKNQRLHRWNKKLPFYFYTLPEYFQAALAAGYALEHFSEITSPEDSAKFNRRYQLYRFPMILFLVFKKIL